MPVSQSRTARNDSRRLASAVWELAGITPSDNLAERTSRHASGNLGWVRDTSVLL